MEQIKVTRSSRRGRPRRLSNEDTINTIVINYNMGDTQAELAEKYGVSVSTIRRILRERSDK